MKVDPLWCLSGHKCQEKAKSLFCAENERQCRLAPPGFEAPGEAKVRKTVFVLNFAFYFPEFYNYIIASNHIIYFGNTEIIVVLLR